MQVYGEGRSEDFDRENMGISTGGGTEYPFKKFMTSYTKTEPVELIQDPPIIWIAVDPSGGGDNSHYIIIALADYQGYSVVSGLVFVLDWMGWWLWIRWSNRYRDQRSAPGLSLLFVACRDASHS